MTEDAEIVQEFLIESHENLDQLDHDLVELEQNPGSRELLSSIFRTIHTIKGTSGFLAFQRLEALTHVGENLLSRLRDGELAMTEQIAEALLRMVDTVRGLLDLIERTESDAGPSLDVDSVVAAIAALLDDEPAAAEADVPAVEEAPVVEAIVAAVPDDAQPHDEQPQDAQPADAAPAYDEPAPAQPAPPAAVDPDPAGEGDDGGARRSVVDSSVRVDVELLDSLVQLVGELVLTRNQILQKVDSQDDAELVRASQRLNLVASELQEGVMKTRMQPIGQVWAKMPRIVRDLAHQLGRKVDLDMEGHETELDRSLLEALKGPLTHLVRNALDHGLESPDERVRLGKPEEGRLSLRAFHESGQVVVEISDDGKGIDIDRVGAVAVDRGVVTADQLRRMEAREIQQLIFRPGFSTATEVTNVSGRGVGMDVVRTNIERIGGSVDLASQPGQGTTCRVRIPLTLAIIPALLVGEGGERYAIPQANLVELVRLEGEDLKRSVEVLAGAPVLRLRGHLLPLVSLAGALGIDRDEEEPLTIVVLNADDIRFGLTVAEVHDTQEIVVKPIGRQMKSLSMYAGATIMGDGRVSLILDVAGLAQEHAADASAVTAEAKSAVDDKSALLILEAAPGHRAALPLGAVSRLEEFGLDSVERSGATEAVQYRDGILQLIRLAPALGLDEDERTREQLSVIVHDDGEHRIGIVIDKVLDVVEATITRSDVGRRPGVLGSAVVQGRVTDLVDLDAVVAMAGVGA